MIKLREALKNILTNIGRTRYETAPDDIEYPYLVYNLSSSSANEDQEIMVLDVDVWDSPEDDSSERIESLGAQVWGALHRYHYLDEHIQFTIHRMSRMVIEDPDVRIKRRKLMFQLRYYDRGGM